MRWAVVAASLLVAACAMPTEPGDRCFQARQGLVAATILLADQENYTEALSKLQALVELYCPLPVDGGPSGV